MSPTLTASRFRSEPWVGSAVGPSGRPHRPLRALSVSMVAAVVGCTVGLLVDDRTMFGLNVWDKPLKFSLSVLVYAVTWGWLIERLPRGRRSAGAAGTVAAVFLGVEMAVIIGQTFRDVPSHFNVSTPLDAALWSVMAASISLVWAASLVIAILLAKNPPADPARAWAVRAGVLTAVLGMLLGLLMVGPTSAQLAAPRLELVGAHAVGVPDGGAGLPLLGWSTVGGDLRIPHFVGMHALQALPLLLITLELLARRGVELARPALRLSLMRVATGAYLAVLALLVWQAERGQSIVHPDGWTLGASGLILCGTGIAAVRSWTRFDR